jgi:hypothetical protein
MQVRVIRPMAAMRVEHGNGASSACLAPDGARAIIPAWRPTAPARAQHDRRVLVPGRAEQRRDRQEDRPRDDARLKGLAHLAHPVVDMDFGAASAPRRCAAHRHQRLALSTGQAALCEVPHLFRGATRQPLGPQGIIVGRLVARMGVGEPVPVLSQDLLEDMPVPRRCYTPQDPPSGGRRGLGAAVGPPRLDAVHPPSARTSDLSPPSHSPALRDLLKTPRRPPVLWAAEKSVGPWPCSSCPSSR